VGISVCCLSRQQPHPRPGDRGNGGDDQAGDSDPRAHGKPGLFPAVPRYLQGGVIGERRKGNGGVKKAVSSVYCVLLGCTVCCYSPPFSVYTSEFLLQTFLLVGSLGASYLSLVGRSLVPRVTEIIAASTTRV